MNNCCAAQFRSSGIPNFLADADCKKPPIPHLASEIPMYKGFAGWGTFLETPPRFPIVPRLITIHSSVIKG